MNEFRVCDKCRAIDSVSLISKLKELDNSASFVIGCQNFCGIGAIKQFVILNGIPIIAEDENKLIELVKERLKK